MLKGITQHGLLPILGLAFKIGLLIVTALNTYGILYLVSQDRIWAAAGLILFEVGLVYWWLVFKNDTEASVIQMAISLIMFVACMLLVAAANALHLGAVSADMLGEGTIPKVIIMAVVIQLCASLIYPLASQEHIAALVNQIALGLVWAKAQSNVMANLDRLAEDTQMEIEDRMWQTIQGRIRQTANDRLSDPAGTPPTTVIEGAVAPPATRPTRRTWRDRVFGRHSAPPPDLSNSTHGEVGTSTPPTAVGQGGLATMTDDDMRRFIQLLREVERQAAPEAHPNGQEVKPSHPQ